MNDSSIFVGSTRWWQAGKIDWVLKLEKEVLIFSDDIRNYAYLTDPKSLLGKDAIIVTLNSEKTLKREVAPYFDSYIKLDNIEINRAGITELSFNVFKCYNYKIPNKEYFNRPMYRQLKGLDPFK